MHQHKHGFSLVELSIVLVILGLLVGGVLAGKALIRTSEVRKTVADIDKVKTAGLAFRDKYLGLPGDLTNATSFWGAADGGDGLGTDCYVAQSATATCNGNGNGMINGLASSEGPEGYRFWQQLVNAGLYDGNFSGVPTTPNYTFYYNDLIGTNIPRSTLNSQAGMSIAYWWTNLVTSLKKQNAMTIATCCWSDATTRRSLEGGGLLAEDLWNIDTKLDDGAPLLGSIQIYAAYGGSLSATQYNLATGTTAQPIIGLGF